MKKRIRRVVWRALNRFAPPEMVVALQFRQTTLSQRRTAFPPKNLVVADKMPPGSVLVLAPHPDDEIIGPGGTICHHLQQNDPVTVLYLTDGRGMVPTDTSLVEIRRQEAKQIGQEYSLKQIFWDIPDTTLGSNPMAIERLTAVLKEVQPDYIYLPSFFDRQHDHFGANQLLVDTLRQYNQARVIILGFEVWDNISYPNFIVNISDTFEQKSAMMALYQTPMAAADFVALFRHRNALHYSLFIDSSHQISEGYAEAFYRLDAADFVPLFETYKNSLVESHHPMTLAMS